MHIGILGGTGPQGRGLARRLAAAGHEVILGSRSAERAQQIAVECSRVGTIPGGSNSEAAADLVIVTMPDVGHAELLGALSDELVGGEDPAAVAVVCDLATAIPGARGIYAGRLRNAGPVEGRAGNLIAINRRYHAHAAIRITDLR